MLMSKTEGYRMCVVRISHIWFDISQNITVAAGHNCYFVRLNCLDSANEIEREIRKLQESTRVLYMRSGLE